MILQSFKILDIWLKVHYVFPLADTQGTTEGEFPSSDHRRLRLSVPHPPITTLSVIKVYTWHTDFRSLWLRQSYDAVKFARNYQSCSNLLEVVEGNRTIFYVNDLVVKEQSISVAQARTRHSALRVSRTLEKLPNLANFGTSYLRNGWWDSYETFR